MMSAEESEILELAAHEWPERGVVYSLEKYGVGLAIMARTRDTTRIKAGIDHPDATRWLLLMLRAGAQTRAANHASAIEARRALHVPLKHTRLAPAVGVPIPYARSPFPPAPSAPPPAPRFDYDEEEERRRRSREDDTVTSPLVAAAVEMVVDSMTSDRDSGGTTYSDTSSSDSSSSDSSDSGGSSFDGGGGDFGGGGASGSWDD